MSVVPIYLFYLLKSFTPFSPFLVPFLIDVKKFKNKEIYNTLNAYFFISSLFVSLFVFLIVRFFGNSLSLFIDTFIEIIACFLLYIMDERNFIIGKLVSTLHGSSTALNSVLKSVIVSNVGSDKNERKLVMNNITIVKCVSSVFSAWIGQDIVIRTGKHDLNQIISCITLISSLLMTFCIHQNKTQQTNKLSIYKEILDNCALFFDFEILSHCFLSITANILVICLAFFSANVFIERRKCGRNRFIKYIFCIMAPLRYISYIIIKICSLFVKQIKENQENEIGDKKEIVIHGYIDGIFKISSAIICYYMGKIKIEDNFRYPLSLGITILTIASLFCLYIVNSLSLSYLFFTISFSLSTSVKIILYASFNSHKYKNFIFSLNMFISSLIHVLLSYISIYRKSNVRARFKYYFFVSVSLSCLSLVFFQFK